MKLELIDVISSPLDYMNQAIWISEQRESFLLTDIFKVVEITTKIKVNTEILFECTTKDDAYKIKKPYEDRFIPDIYNEVSFLGKNGFQYLSKADYDKIKNLNSGSNTFFDLTNVFGVQSYELPVKTNNGLILRFTAKEVNVLDTKSDTLETKYSLPFKKKEVTAIH